MIEIRSDFECGNAKNVERIAKDRYRIEVVGDKPVYCYYFCFDVTNTGPETEVAIEVWHDPQVNDVPGFMSHFPTTIWIRPQGWHRYRGLPQERCDTLDDHLVIRLPVESEQSLRVTDMWPAPYSDTCQFLRNLSVERSDRCELIKIGESVRGRDILGIRAGRPGAPRMVCVAGQHPIEFSGVWAMRGIADYVTSLIPRAASLRQSMEIEVIPIVNPDGNVMGRNGFNAEGLDMYLAFGEDPDAQEPECHEGKLVWQWALDRPIALWMNVHNYLGWATNSENPYDGWYEVADPVFRDETKARLYQALRDTMRLETDGPSTHLRRSVHSANTMCYQFARRYDIPSVFYEINGGTGGAFRSAKRGLHVFKRAVDTLLEFR